MAAGTGDGGWNHPGSGGWKGADRWEVELTGAGDGFDVEGEGEGVKDDGRPGVWSGELGR